MTREEIISRQEKFKQYKNRYKNYPGSPGDDGLLGIYGYTVRDERGYINHTLAKCKKALEYMDKNNTDVISDRELFYL